MNRRTLQHHDHLAPEYGELVRALWEDEAARTLDLGFASPGLPRFLTTFAYPVSPWPVLISAATKQRFASLVNEMPSLLRRAILRYYAHDHDSFSAQYGLPRGAYEQLAERPAEVDHLSARYDVVFVDDEPRLLEVNVGSKLGGWQLDWLCPKAAEVIRRRPALQHWRVSHTSTLESFCRFMRRALDGHLHRKASGTLLVLLNRPLLESGFPREFAAVYERVLAETSSPGLALFESDPRSFALDANGRIECQRHIVDGVVIGGALDRMPPEFPEAHLRHQLFCPDNWLARLFADKTNFAVLHAAKSAGWLSDGDAALIDRYIPWSARLTDQVVEWHGEQISVRDLALAQRAAFVLKRGLSRQGQHVFIGRFLSDTDWAEAIAAAGTRGDWILQEYCPPDRLYAPNGHAAVREHDPVWGIFGFGGEYGGAYCRLMESTNTRGAINAARGATEAVVLEV